MKKLIAVLMAIAMIAALSVTAFADTLDALTPAQSKDVTATYSDRNTKPATYSIELVWGSMEFTYQTVIQDWNATSHKWEDRVGAEAGWVCASGANEITISNDSSVAVNAAFAYAAKNESGVAGAFSVADAQASAWTANTNTLAMAVAAEDTDATEYVVTLTLSNALDAEWVDDTAVGAVTITLS